MLGRTAQAVSVLRDTARGSMDAWWKSAEPGLASGSSRMAVQVLD